MKSDSYLDDKFHNSDKQMRSVWAINTIPKSEKELGKHSTQKPLELLKRIISASTNAEMLVLDLFNGGGTTGIACEIVGNRSYIGCDIEQEYLDLTIKRCGRLAEGMF